MLTNAVCLKAPWETPFPVEATAETTFHRLDGHAVPVPVMRQSGDLRYVAGDGYQAVDLPYAGRELSTIVAVPDPGAFAAVEQRLDAPLLASITSGLRPTRVNLDLPRFRFSAKASLKTALSELGMPVAFPDRADFSPMTTEEPLQIIDVVRQAFIAVDEKGTEAAAATAVVVGVTAAPAQQVDVVVDRPFLFLIRDNPTGTVLFEGRVLDPAA